MFVSSARRMTGKSQLLRFVLAGVGLFCCSNIWALTENPVLTHWDTLFYTLMVSGVLFSTVIIVAYRAYYWLVYVLFSFLLTVNIAGMDGTLAYLIGESDFVTWVVPYLLTASVAAYGYWMIAIRLDKTHALGRYANYFFALAAVSALFPLSCYFWLGKISLVTMWVPVNILFLGMVLGQVLPPLSWPSEDRYLGRVIRLFPWVVGLFAVGSYLVHFSYAGFSQSELNLVNRLVLILFAGFSMTIVIWQAFISARQKEQAERRAIEAVKNEAELQLELLQAEQDYQTAVSAAEQHRLRLATVSHDLKQPISALRIAIDQVQQTTGGDERLSQAVEYIASLAHSYIDEGVRESSVDVSDRAEQSKQEAVSTSLFGKTLLQMFSGDAEKRGIQLTLRCPDHLVSVDPLSTLRIMNNLISNAIKHAGATRILLAFRSRGDQVVFQMYDNGRGMSEKVLGDALTPLNKGADSDGHGLGLGIVKELCIAGDMPFAINSIPGRGTSVSVSMRRAETSHDSLTVTTNS